MSLRGHVEVKERQHQAKLFGRRDASPAGPRERRRQERRDDREREEYERQSDHSTERACPSPLGEPDVGGIFYSHLVMREHALCCMPRFDRIINPGALHPLYRRSNCSEPETRSNPAPANFPVGRQFADPEVEDVGALWGKKPVVAEVPDTPSFFHKMEDEKKAPNASVPAFDIRAFANQPYSYGLKHGLDLAAMDAMMKATAEMKRCAFIFLEDSTAPPPPLPQAPAQQPAPQPAPVQPVSSALEKLRARARVLLVKGERAMTDQFIATATKVQLMRACQAADAANAGAVASPPDSGAA